MVLRDGRKGIRPSWRWTSASRTAARSISARSSLLTRQGWLRRSPALTPRRSGFASSGGGRVLDDATLRYLVEVDYQRRLALVALDAAGNGVGIARYEGGRDEGVAEIAVAVAPDWRGVGLGSRLLRMLGEAAVARGFRQFVASYFVGNRDVEGLVKACGLPHRSQVSQGVVEVQLLLPASVSSGPGTGPQPPA